MWACTEGDTVLWIGTTWAPSLIAVLLVEIEHDGVSLDWWDISCPVAIITDNDTTVDDDMKSLIILSCWIRCVFRTGSKQALMILVQQGYHHCALRIRIEKNKRNIPFSQTEVRQLLQFLWS